MARRALITGICGFIGSHLTERLLENGWAVDGIDHHAGAGNLTAVRDRVHLVEQHLSADGLAALPARSYDAVFHLAGRVGPTAVVQDPLTMLREHAEHTAAVCEFGGRANAVVVLASSSEVYQWNGGERLREDDALTLGPSHLPRCAYAVSKLYVEHLGLAYARQKGVKVIVARFFNTVGPRQRDAFVLPILARQALQGEPLTVHGDGSQIRTFTLVQDVAEALERLVDAPAAVGEVVNVAASEPCLPIAAVAERLAAHVLAEYELSAPPRIVRVPYESTGDLAWQGMRSRRPEVEKLRRLTGLVFPNRWDDMLRGVCADWAQRLCVPRRLRRSPHP